LLRFRSKTVNPKELAQTLGSAENGIKEISKALPELDFAGRWELIGLILPELDKTAARDTVRLLFNGYTVELANKTEDYRTRILAIECLGYLSRRETVELLLALMEHKDDEVQICAAGALKNQTPRLVVPCLIDALLAETVTPARAGEVLLSMGYLAEEFLLEKYPQADPRQQARILELLTLAANPKCRPFISEGLKSPDPLLRTKALEAVAAFSLTELWPQVVDSLLDPAWALRVKTLKILERLNLPETREYAELLLEDEDDWVRRCAAACLENMGKAGRFGYGV